MRQLALSLVVAAAAFSAAAPAHANILLFTGALSGANELPPNLSPGTGVAWVKIDDASLAMEVSVTFAGLLGGVTASHIHCCTALPGVGNVGIATVTPTLTGFPSAVSAGSYNHIFDMNLAGSWNPGFITGHGGTTASAFAALLTGLNAGDAYFNVHSTTNGGGEIRGFLQAVPEPSSAMLVLAALAGLGWAGCRGRSAG